MPKISAEARTERRQQLIAAGWRCAGRMGYRDMTVDDVCAEARVSKGTFYGYFTSKQDLLIALLEEDEAGLDSVLEDLNRRAIPNVSRLRSFAREMCERGADPARVQVRSDLWAAILTERAVRDHVVAAVEGRRATLRGWIEDAIASGELTPVPANAFASVLLALGDGLTLHSSLDPSGFRWNNIARVLAAVFGGLGAE